MLATLANGESVTYFYCLTSLHALPTTSTNKHEMRLLVDPNEAGTSTSFLSGVKFK